MGNKNQKEKRILWNKTKRCLKCGGERLPFKSYCEHHYLQRISERRCGGKVHWKQLKDLLHEQNFKCGITGIKISLGDKMTVELDHVLPVSRGGMHGIENLRWVSGVANRLKRNFTDDELVMICKSVVKTLTQKL